jgi:bifunctional UDP-N-acetylglucosamine pyrophosphorylase/glucosamine-1-phosphate N-acetyltransferase
MQQRTCLAIVLAAGEGVRMRSDLPKVLHRIGGRPLIEHVMRAATQAGGSEIALVIGPGRDDVAAAARRVAPQTQVFTQRERLGTAHATLTAQDAIARKSDDIVIMFADTPLVRVNTLEALRAPLADGAAVAVLGFRAETPAGYGRLITDGDTLLAIREDRDAAPEERSINLCNAGLMALAGEHALAILGRIGNANAKGEYYLTDAVAIAHEMGLKAVAIETSEDDVRGINNKVQLAEAEAELQKRLRAAALDSGVTLVAPDTVFLCDDTKFGKDVTIEPFVVFGPGVTVDDGALVRSFSHLEGARVGKNARVGPYARLRAGTELGADVHIGNFVEVKAAQIEDGAKANHLAYIGDARVGERANVGAGTITCNYDGVDKHRTDIGRESFIGSNSALVAPVRIGDRSYVGSGSVITMDVPDDSLALGRGQQTVKEGWAKRLREVKALGKKTPKRQA